MVSAKRLAQLARKWQSMAAMGRKRITRTTKAKTAAECHTATSVAMKGHCIVYTSDEARFEVPLAYLGSSVLRELLRMSKEEFGFASGDRITMPCVCHVLA